MCLCDHSLLTSISMRQVITSSLLFYMDFTRKTAFFEEWPWFRFNNLGLILGTNLKFYTSVGKGLELKVRNFGGLVPTSVEVTGEKLVRSFFVLSPPPSWIGLKSISNHHHHLHLIKFRFGSSAKLIILSQNDTDI